MRTALKVISIITLLIIGLVVLLNMDEFDFTATLVGGAILSVNSVIALIYLKREKK